MLESVWSNLHAYLDVVIPIFLPAAFIALNFIVKSILGDFSLKSVGPEISLSGWSLFTVSFLGLAYHGKLQPHDVLVGVILSLVFLFAWFICILLAYSRFNFSILNYSYQPVVSTIIGIPSFYFCCLFTWKVLQWQ